MKYQRTDAFILDYRRLSKPEQALVRAALPLFIKAAERVAAEPGTPWPATLRVKSVEGAKGVWEMTWSFSGPDGRATFEWSRVGDEVCIRWRRIGSHAILRDP